MGSLKAWVILWDLLFRAMTSLFYWHLVWLAGTVFWELKQIKNKVFYSSRKERLVNCISVFIWLIILVWFYFIKREPIELLRTWRF